MNKIKNVIKYLKDFFVNNDKEIKIREKYVDFINSWIVMKALNDEKYNYELITTENNKEIKLVITNDVHGDARLYYNLIVVKVNVLTIKHYRNSVLIKVNNDNIKLNKHDNEYLGVLAVSEYSKTKQIQKMSLTRSLNAMSDAILEYKFLFDDKEEGLEFLATILNGGTKSGSI